MYLVLVLFLVLLVWLLLLRKLNTEKLLIILLLHFLVDLLVILHRLGF